MNTKIAVTFLVVLVIGTTIANPIDNESGTKPQSPSSSYSTLPAISENQNQGQGQAQPTGQLSDSYSNDYGTGNGNGKPQTQPARPSTSYNGPVPDVQQAPSTYQQQAPSNTDSKM